MNCPTAHRHIRDPLLSNAGKATALTTRCVQIQELLSRLLILRSVPLISPQTVVALNTQERKTILKEAERGG